MTPEQELMLRVWRVCGAEITKAAQGTDYPPAFLAALAANETGGDPTRTRFEPLVFAHLGRVIVGQESHYGALGAQDLIEAYAPPHAGWGLRESLTALANFATSWGPCQVMGYHALTRKIPLSWIVQLSSHFDVVVGLLNDFRREWRETAFDAAHLLDDWNTGRPDGKTADPQYISNGLGRMALYGTIGQWAPGGTETA